MLSEQHQDQRDILHKAPDNVIVDHHPLDEQHRQQCPLLREVILYTDVP